MLEAGFCTVCVNSAGDGNILYKIPDPTSNYGQTTKRCCDIIGRLKSHAVYIECKWNSSYAAFNLNRIEDHQAMYLTEFGKSEGAISYIILGMHVARGDTRAYIFNWNAIKPLYEKGFSFYAKVLSELPYNAVCKGVFSYCNIIEKEDIVKVLGDVYGNS